MWTPDDIKLNERLTTTNIFQPSIMVLVWAWALRSDCLRPAVVGRWDMSGMSTEGNLVSYVGSLNVFCRVSGLWDGELRLVGLTGARVDWLSCVVEVGCWDIWLSCLVDCSDVWLSCLMDCLDVWLSCVMDCWDDWLSCLMEDVDCWDDWEGSLDRASARLSTLRRGLADPANSPLFLICLTDCGSLWPDL